MCQRVLRGSEVLAEGDITIACVDRGGVKPRRLPSGMVDRLQALQPEQ
jgi:acyl-CoA thioesterase FadM